MARPLIIRFEEMAVAINRYLQAAMSGEALHGLGLKVGLDPA